MNETEAIELAADGTPMIRGTSVPVQQLLEHLQAGGVLTDFVQAHPEVDPDTAVQVLELAWQALSPGNEENTD